MKKAKGFALVLVLALSCAFLAAEDIVLESDVVKLVLHEQTGTFTLYRRNGSKDRFQAFNEVSDSSSSTFFSVKAGDSFLPLRRSFGVTLETKRNADDSASFIWKAGESVEVEIKFTLVVTDETKAADSVRIDMTVMNLTDKEADFAVKAVIDTMLGETSRIHFTTASGTAVYSEKSWNSMARDKWISSSDGIGTASFVLAGSAATDPEFVLAASREILLSDTWKPVINEGRTFATFTNPNNSALGIWYKPVKLKLYEKSSSTMFIATAANGDIPPVSTLVGIEAEDGESGLSESTVASATQIVDTAVGSEGGKVLAAQKPELDYAYIQQLLDRIKEIEESDNPDSEEIAKLSAEIDALILELTK